MFGCPRLLGTHHHTCLGPAAWDGTIGCVLGFGTGCCGCLGPPFGTMGVGCLGPVVWDQWDQCLGPPFGATGVWTMGVWGLGPWVFGTNLDHCVGIMGVWDQPSGTVWDHEFMGVWDRETSCLGQAFGTSCLGESLRPAVWDHWVFGTMGVCDQLGTTAVWDHRLGPCLGPPFGTMGVFGHGCFGPWVSQTSPLGN